MKGGRKGIVKIVTAAEMSAIDRAAASDWSLSGEQLMEQAGRQAWQLLLPRLGPGARIAFVAGAGANGGDALVMARYCALEGRFHPLLLAARTMDTTNRLQICRRLGIVELDWQQQAEEATDALKALSPNDWIVDGIAGTGLRGPVRPPQVALVEAINQSAAAVCSVDVPSGIGDHYQTGWPAVQADLTITMELPKRCLYLYHARPLCGELLVAQVGFPPALTTASALRGELLTTETLAADLPPLPDSSYKQQRGVVGIFAGSPGAAGAARLAAHAAAVSAAGIVRLYIDQQLYPLPGPAAIMTTPLQANHPLPASLDDCHALLIGPGWGQDHARERLLLQLLESAPGGVLDADALNIIARRRQANPAEQLRLHDRWVVTPHPGECARLLDRPTAEVIADPFAAALELAASLSATVVLKSHVSLIATAAGNWWVHDGNNAALATGGSGDVLAGIIAALMARRLQQGQSPVGAARAGVLLHGLAGARAWRTQGWFLADDLIAHIAAELKMRLRRGR